MEMDIRDGKNFTPAELERLFQSVGWLSARYAVRLSKALANCDTVYSAWDGQRLVGLVNAIDDGELTAYIHHLLVDPEYQGQGIGRVLIERMKARYEGYLYLLLSAENKALIPFYEALGFEAKPESTLIHIKTE